jgi:hypothetical protein
MKRSSLAAVALFLFSSLMCRAADIDAPGNLYDGQWSVNFVCTDTQDRNGLVKGYEYKFSVTIAGGKLQGQYGTKGAPASIAYSGSVENDGTLEVKAVGNTGRSDYSVGKLAQGTDYSYTMAGRLDREVGQAVRREVRPCTAVFAKL